MSNLSSHRRRSKRMLSDGDGEPEFQVAPMVDVLLVLMLFFMSITTTEILKKEKNLHLPDAKAATNDPKVAKKNEIIVNVTWNDLDKTAGFSLDGKAYSSAHDMVAPIEADKGNNPDAYVVIRADRLVEYSNISDIMNVSHYAGIATVSFAAVTGGGSQKTAASPHS